MPLEKFSLISYFTGFKIDTNPGLAKSRFEQPDPIHVRILAICIQFQVILKN